MKDFAVLVSSLALLCVMPSMCVRAESSTIAVDENRMVVEHEGFRFGFADATGTTLAPMHAQVGLHLDGQAVVTTVADPEREDAYTVATAEGLKARLRVEASDGLVSITVAPQKEGMCEVALSLGGMPVAYGLGDEGGYKSKTLNLVKDKAHTYKITQNGAYQRWLSSFAIFPRNRLAGVVFGGEARSVTLGPEAYTMTVNANGPATFHYLVGDMHSIYRNYRSLLSAKGYPHLKPKFRLFELGWESWAALGWQTNAETMLGSIKSFQDKGYPIRWAVSGSGFWEEGGTTTSFGKFGEKFPDPEEFKSALHKRNVKWMIGLRTNFTPPGGPHAPVTEKRNQNLKVNTFNGNPHSEVGIEKGYFLKDANGELWKKASGTFPITPCYMLDGGNPEAVDWYAGLYKQWGVDGIKEDTMMRMGGAHIDIFNHPVARVAEDGGLVMARCGSFSAPGTLLRVEDTNVYRDLGKRIEINYQQYAACGAPNVYSDTYGFRRIGNYDETIVRHGWLLALTAGMSVGIYPGAWNAEQQAIFKKPIDFHYQIGPTLYDAAMKSYQTGYPYTLTPLGIAYPDDPNTAEPANHQWMAGESLLCAPLVKNRKSGRMDIYLPEGTWFDYDTGKKYQGPKLLKDFAMPVDKTPCFVGGKGILVTRSSDEAPLRAHIYPVGSSPETFTFHHPDGESTSRLRLRKGSERGVWNANTGEPVPFELSAESGAFSFALHPQGIYEYVL